MANAEMRNCHNSRTDPFTRNGFADYYADETFQDLVDESASKYGNRMGGGFFEARVPFYPDAPSQFSSLWAGGTIISPTGPGHVQQNSVIGIAIGVPSSDPWFNLFREVAPASGLGSPLAGLLGNSGGSCAAPWLTSSLWGQWHFFDGEAITSPTVPGQVQQNSVIGITIDVPSSDLLSPSLWREAAAANGFARDWNNFDSVKCFRKNVENMPWSWNR
jgi:hypothetical protein